MSASLQESLGNLRGTGRLCRGTWSSSSMTTGNGCDDYDLCLFVCVFVCTHFHVSVLASLHSLCLSLCLHTLCFYFCLCLSLCLCFELASICQCWWCLYLHILCLCLCLCFVLTSISQHWQVCTAWPHFVAQGKAMLGISKWLW